MRAIEMLRKAKEQSENAAQMMSFEFIEAINNTTVIVKDDAWIHALCADASAFLKMVDERDTLAADLVLEKEDVSTFTMLLNSVGVYCPQVKAKDYDPAKAEAAADATIEVQELVLYFKENHEDIPADVRRALAFDVLMPLWAEVKHLEARVNVLGESINAKYDKLRGKVLDAYKGKRSSWIFGTGRFDALDAFVAREGKLQSEWIEKRTLHFQQKAADKKAAKLRRISERREAKLAESKKVTPFEGPLTAPVHEESMANALDLSFIKFNKVGAAAGMMNVGASCKALQKVRS